MVPQIVQLGTLFTTLAQLTGRGGESVDKAKQILGRIGHVYNVTSTNSASVSAQRAAISPMVVVERDLIHQDYMTDLMNVVNLRDIKDILAHLSLQGTVNGIKISDLVEGINPNRRGGMLALQGCEDFAGSQLISGMEAGVVNQPGKPKPVEGRVTIAGKEYSDLTAVPSLAVGRTVIAQVQLGETLVNIPLNFRQIPMPASAKDLEVMFDAARPTDGWYARTKMYDAREIDSPAYFRGTDVIQREFNIRMNDFSGYYEEASKRQSGNRVAAINTGIMSMNSQANTIILSSETARQLELEHGISFDSKGLAGIAKGIMANTIVIVNDGEGVVTFWNTGSNMKEVYTIRQLSTMSKKDTSLDLNTLMKMFGGR
jgi:hypothetical protein